MMTSRAGDKRLECQGEQCRPRQRRNLPTCPVVDLPSGDTAQVRASGLADAGAGHESGEVGVQARSHGDPDMKPVP